MHKLKVGIVGGAGYTGGELIRLLLRHPQAEISFVHSRSHAGKPLYSVFADLLGETELCFSATADKNPDLVFLCLSHGEAASALTAFGFADHVRIIDLSQDFRLQEPGTENGFVYGLPELNRSRIRTAQRIANPGCFATAIQLALLPLAHAGLLQSDIHIQASTGSTGAGRTPSESTHFSWRSNNHSVYKAFTHQHLHEIGRSLTSLQPGLSHELIFIPQRGAFTRGILATAVLDCPLDEAEIRALYRHYYQSHPFTWVCDAETDLKQVLNTNKCFLSLQKHGGRLMLVSVIDNLLKGASGQAVQNMNLMCGFAEDEGLRLKASAY